MRAVMAVAWLVMLGAALLAGPVLKVDVAYPTKDKPQSKLWWAQGKWWAWLGVKDGSSVWRREAAGWQREVALDGVLRGWPGQADVWSDGGRACAALIDAQRVDAQRVAVICLQWRGGRWELEGKPALLEDGAVGLETVTIAAERNGRLWVAYNKDRRMWVRAREKGGWSAAMEVSATAADKDDICAVVAMADGVGVMWSDQAADTVWFRRQRRGKWEAAEVVERGNKTADDHIRMVVRADGRLVAAMKNSVDAVGKEQLVLRERGVDGQWRSTPYAMRTATEEPSRPAVLVGADGELWLLHTVYGRGARQGQSWIVKQRVGGKAEVLLEERGARLNDVTGPKQWGPKAAPRIVLASDGEGGVYEARVE